MRLKFKNPFVKNLYYDVLKEFTLLLIQNRSLRCEKNSYLTWMRIGSQKLVMVDMVPQLDTCIPKISQIRLKSHFSCSYPSNTSIINKIGENLISFDSFFWCRVKTWNSKFIFNHFHFFSPNHGPVMVEVTVERVKTYVWLVESISRHTDMTQTNHVGVWTNKTRCAYFER